MRILRSLFHQNPPADRSFPFLLRVPIRSLCYFPIFLLLSRSLSLSLCFQSRFLLSLSLPAFCLYSCPLSISLFLPSLSLFFFFYLSHSLFLSSFSLSFFRSLLSSLSFSFSLSGSISPVTFSPSCFFLRREQNHQVST